MVWWGEGGAWWGSIGGWKVSAGVHSLQQHKQRPPSFGEAKWMTMMLTPMAVLNNGDGDVFGRATLGEAVLFWWLVWLVQPEPHWGPRRRHTVSLAYGATTNPVEKGRTYRRAEGSGQASRTH